MAVNELSNKVTDRYSVYLCVSCLVIQEYTKQLAATKISSLRLKTQIYRLYQIKLLQVINYIDLLKDESKLSMLSFVI